ncbi:hypothetical protein [Staphylococcus xylosus]|uniref:hypothetical protein n=1 Tax=Staphylococcus xylosus TaxID=1288 RepID=UPI000D1D4605|nr:hypothetical protein [Staphylococcus xylosus]PTI64190.1 hypothetical protein BU095_06230 [Staphylococcus xylosus]
MSIKNFGLFDSRGNLMFSVSYDGKLYELVGVKQTYYSGKHWYLNAEQLDTFMSNDKLTKAHQVSIFDCI